MSTVVQESADYLHIVHKLIARTLEKGMDVWDKDGTPERYKIRAFVGSVWELYYAVKPLVGDMLRGDSVEFFRMAMSYKEEKGRLLETWEKTNEALQQILQALKTRGLLIRVSTIQVEGST